MCINETYEKINPDLLRKIKMEVWCRLDWVVPCLAPVFNYFKPCWVTECWYMQMLLIVLLKYRGILNYCRSFNNFSYTNFDVLLTVHLSIFISVINQLDVQNVCFTISLFHASTCFEHMCSKHVEAWNKLIVKQTFLYIKLVNYWDKLSYTIHLR